MFGTFHIWLDWRIFSKLIFQLVLDFPENFVVNLSQSEKLLNDLKMISKKAIENYDNQKDDEIRQFLSDYLQIYLEKAVALEPHKLLKYDESILTLTKIILIREEILYLITLGFMFIDNRTRESATKVSKK